MKSNVHFTEVPESQALDQYHFAKYLLVGNSKKALADNFARITNVTYQRLAAAEDINIGQFSAN